jgi:hypothetical protein
MPAFMPLTLMLGAYVRLGTLQKKGEKAPSFRAGMNRPLLIDKQLF